MCRTNLELEFSTWSRVYESVPAAGRRDELQHIQTKHAVARFNSLLSKVLLSDQSELLILPPEVLDKRRPKMNMPLNKSAPWWEEKIRQKTKQKQ